MSVQSRVPRTPSHIARHRTHKICGSCFEDKPLEAFHRSKHNVDGRKTACRACRNHVNARAYASDSSGRRATMQARYRRQRDIIEDAKRCPCADCGQTYPSAVMHFHHRDPSTKINAVATLVNAAEHKLRNEIAKCDVVCANCHIMRHLASKIQTGESSGRRSAVK